VTVIVVLSLAAPAADPVTTTPYVEPPPPLPEPPHPAKLKISSRTSPL
jgi:hypothetical protein